MENQPQAGLTLSDIEPGIEKLKAIAEECRSLTIAGPSDVAGYDKVHEARMNLRRMRIAIKNRCEEKRADAVKFQKDVISFQNRLISIIEPVEDALAAQEEAVDREREKVKRSALMPARLERLATIESQDGGAEAYNKILAMDDAQFESFFNQQHALFLQAKEQKMKEEQERRDREAEEAKVKAEAEAKAEALRVAAEAKAEEDRKAAEAKAAREKAMFHRRERLIFLGTVTFTDDEIYPLDDVQFEAYYNGRVAEKNRIEAERVEAAKKKVEDDRIAAEKAEADRKAAEERGRREAEEKARAEKEAADRKAAEEAAVRERQTKYLDFMAEHGVTEYTKGQFHIRTEGDVTILYKEVGRITL